MDFKEAIQDFTGQPISKQVILDLLKDYKRPYDKINELVKTGELILTKRGIYVPGAKLKIAQPEPFLLANHLLGPSYVSIDSALSYWGIIPEKVYEISSITTQHSKTYKTPVGRFSYTHITLPYYSFGLRRVELAKNQWVLVASAEKALCDKIITTSGILLRSIAQTNEFLIDDLRVDEETLANFNVEEMTEWIADAPKRSSLEMLVKTLKTYDKAMA